VWRPKYTPDITEYFLKFSTSGMKKIAYAASFGTDKWEFTPEETLECRKLLMEFDHVSVRESSAVKLCEDYFSRSVFHVVDPTLLLPVGTYLELIGEDPANDDPADSTAPIVIYMLDQS